MVYVDGEVEDDEMSGVLALLAKSDEARRIVEQHSAVGEWVRVSAQQHAVAGRADDIASAVMSEVVELGLPRVAALDPRRTRSRRERAMVVVVLCATAAAVALYAWRPQVGRRSEQLSRRNGAPTEPAAVERAPAAAGGSVESAPPVASHESAALAQIAAAEPEGQGTDVQAVESPHHPVSIFYMPAATGANGHASSVVVWIGEE